MFDIFIYFSYLFIFIFLVKFSKFYFIKRILFLTLNYLSVFTYILKQNFNSLKSRTILFVTNYMYYLLFIPRVKQNFQDFLTFQAVQECNDFVRIAFSASQLTFESSSDPINSEILSSWQLYQPWRKDNNRQIFSSREKRKNSLFFLTMRGEIRGNKNIKN